MYPILPLVLSIIYAVPTCNAQIAAGGLPDSRPARVQDCASGGDYAGSWKDGEGTYVDSDSVRYNINKKCWNDYFVVKTTKFNGNFYKLGGNLYCNNTSSCTTGVTKSQQTCFTKTDQVSVSIGLEAVFKDVGGISLGADFTESWSKENCFTDEKTDQCSWSDGKCHTMWARNDMVSQEGYKRERCNLGDGDFTNCMADWKTTFPSGVVDYDCGNGCADIKRRGRDSSMRQMPRKLVV